MFRKAISTRHNEACDPGMKGTGGMIVLLSRAVHKTVRKARGYRKSRAGPRSTKSLYSAMVLKRLQDFTATTLLLMYLLSAMAPVADSD